jgi:hypothetical protein
VLGEFFTARVHEIDDALVEGGPHGRLPTVEAKGLTEVSLAALGETLDVGTYDDLVEQIAEGPQTESGEAGILTIPSDFRNKLGVVHDLDPIAEQWSATEELRADGWRKPDTLQVLRELTELARSAMSDGRELWYWWSL